MAASVYATPPPDLSGEEDTALSENSNSNSSQQSNSTQSIISKSVQQISPSLPPPPPPQFITTTTTTPNTNTTTQLTAFISANGSTGVTQLLDVLPDNLKKRRKQSTPIRISATSLEAAAAALVAANGNDALITEAPALDEHTVPKIFLSNVSQLQMKLFAATGHAVHSPDSQTPPIENDDRNSIDMDANDNDDDGGGGGNGNDDDDDDDEDEVTAADDDDDADDGQLESGEINCRMYEHDTFPSEVKRNVHVMHEHTAKTMLEHHSSADDSAVGYKIKVKREPHCPSEHERDWEPEPETTTAEKHHNGGSGVVPPAKHDDWLSMTGLPFPFPPEAAAMLSASGYLPQLPMMTSVPQFGNGDGGMPRPNVPPLRIFNPEAYCDLCNKEFCNKYFLKTHKANKHNIYDPIAAPSAAEMPSTSQLNHMSQVFQMQQQQHHMQLQQQIQQHQQQPQQLEQHKQQLEHQHMLQQQQHKQLAEHQQQQVQQDLEQQQQQQISPVSARKQQQSPLASQQQNIAHDSPVFCDICLKRFTNVFAMRRHRNKMHDMHTINESAHKPDAKASAGASNTAQLYILPEGFREDFTVEQEDTAFTPQPRKLSPQSSQQARDSNFSIDKLKRLGVVNPEAFCEICCKEYCNKYFLKTHKIKRHGIFMNAEEAGKDENRSPWQFVVQTSPLNLMMGGATDPQHQLGFYQNQRSKLEAGEIRKLSVDSLDEDFAVDAKKLKLDEEVGAGNGGLKKLSRRSSNSNNSSSTSTTTTTTITTTGTNTIGIDETSHKVTDETLHHSQDSADAISVDLQKLQSMILQLSDLNAAQRPAACGICGKELDNQYALHAHMVQEHANLGENNNVGVKAASPVCKPEASCKQCDKDFPNAFALQQHLYEQHGIASAATSPIRDGFARPERPMSGHATRPPSVPPPAQQIVRPYIITPTSSYCEICNKELCNKYFMKTHMQRMHGIEIENGAQIGGVICNICNKELCSKYFLRVHKHNTHGIVDEGSPLPQPRVNGGDSAAVVAAAAAAAAADADPIFPIDLKPGEISELSNRYFTHFTEVCPLCNRRFRGSKWLRTHLMTDHGKAGTEKLREIEQSLGLAKPASPTLKIPNGSPFCMNLTDTNFMHKQSLTNLFAGEEPVSSTSKSNKEYHCSFCTFSTPSYAFLFIHERSHMGGQQQQQQQHQQQQPQQPEVAELKIKDEPRLTTAAMPPTMTTSSSSSSSDTRASTPATVTPVPAVSTPIMVSDHLAAATPLTKSHLHKSPDSPYNVLVDVANMTKRPAAYAVPQASEGIVMQSFLMEQVHSHHRNGNASPPTSMEPESSASSSSSPSDRFVPSLVFLPVKERISDKLIVSFTLTPA